MEESENYNPKTKNESPEKDTPMTEARPLPSYLKDVTADEEVSCFKLKDFGELYFKQFQKA